MKKLNHFHVTYSLILAAFILMTFKFSSNATPQSYDLNDATVQFYDPEFVDEDGYFEKIGNAFVYTGQSITPIPIVKLGEITLQKDEDYTVIYVNNKNEGTSTVTIEGKGSYQNSKTASFEISKIDISKDVSFNIGSQMYEGAPVEPYVSAYYNVYKAGTYILTKDTDFTVEYKDNNDEGTGKAIVTGTGKFKGTKTLTFFIVKRQLDGSYSYTLDNYQYYYDGNEKRPEVKITFGINKEELIEGTDYTLEYSSNIEAGTGIVRIAGIGKYKGTWTLNFTITRLALEDAEITLDTTSYIYDGTPKTPVITVNYKGTELIKDTDYDVSYKNNIEEGTATLTVTGKDKYSGTVSKEYTIEKQSIDDASMVLSADTFSYDSTEKRPVVTITLSGQRLREGTDYTLEYKNNTAVGTATVSATGKGLYKGTKVVNYTIVGISLQTANVVLSDTIFTYDGSPKHPDATVTLNGATLTRDVDYLLTYTDNINAGTAYATVTGMGIYSGTVTKPFTILEAGAGMDALYDPGSTIIREEILYTVMDKDDPEVEATALKKQKIKNLSIPDTIEQDGVTYKVTSIGEKAFYKNKNIKTVTIGNNVKSIENYAFYGCTSLKTIKIGSSLDVVGSSAFRKCTALTKIVLPRSLDTLGKCSLQGCKQLKNITIKSNSVVDIKDKAISGISKDAIIHVPKKLIAKYKKSLTPKTGYKPSMAIKK